MFTFFADGGAFSHINGLSAGEQIANEIRGRVTHERKSLLAFVLLVRIEHIDCAVVGICLPGCQVFWMTILGKLAE